MSNVKSTVIEIPVTVTIRGVDETVTFKIKEEAIKELVALISKSFSVRDMFR